MQETRNNCFGLKRRNTTLRQSKTGKYECHKKGGGEMIPFCSLQLGKTCLVQLINFLHISFHFFVFLSLLLFLTIFFFRSAFFQLSLRLLPLCFVCLIYGFFRLDVACCSPIGCCVFLCFQSCSCFLSSNTHLLQLKKKSNVLSKPVMQIYNLLVF